MVCETEHFLWKCSVFQEKTPTELAKPVAARKLSFPCLHGQPFFRQCPRPRKCEEEGCTNSQNTVPHGAVRIFQPKLATKQQNKDYKPCVKACSESCSHEAETSRKISVTDVKVFTAKRGGIRCFTEWFVQVRVLRHSACSFSWISEKLAKKLKLQGPAVTLAVQAIKSQQTNNTQIAELKLTPVQLGDSRATFSIKPYEGKDLTFGTDIIDVNKLKQQYPNLGPVTLQKVQLGR